MKIGGKKEAQAQREDALFIEDCTDVRKRKLASRGSPFWQTHPAKQILRNDFHDDKTLQPDVMSLNPMDLWLS